MNWQDNLIALYLFICKEYQTGLAGYCERMTHYADLSFTDEEVLTIFLYGVMDKHKTVKEIYEKTERYLKSFFTTLPGYVAFIQRINRVHGLFILLIERLQTYLPKAFQPLHLSGTLVTSFNILKTSFIYWYIPVKTLSALIYLD